MNITIHLQMNQLSADVQIICCICMECKAVANCADEGMKSSKLRKVGSKKSYYLEKLDVSQSRHLL